MIIKVNAIEKVQCSKVQRDTKNIDLDRHICQHIWKKFDVQKVQWIQEYKKVT